MIRTLKVTQVDGTLTGASRIEQSLAAPFAVFALGAGSACLYFWGRDLHRFTQWIAAFIGLFVGQLAFYLASTYVVVRWSSRSSRLARYLTVGLVILFAVGFRAMLVPQRPYLSADVYRYVWDGRVQTEGINPYRYAPDAGELSSLRDDRIFPNITDDDKRWLSPYPPAAQFVFFAAALIRPMSVTTMKAMMASFDLLTMLLLMLVLSRSGLDPARAIIFAWHPLLIFEGAHSGHIEAVFIAFLALALFAWSTRNDALTGVALAIATLVKFYPVLLLPAFLIARSDTEINSGADSRDGIVRRLLNRVAHKRNLVLVSAFLVILTVAYVPYIGAGANLFGFLQKYVQEEGFVQSGARYFLLDALRTVLPIPTSMFLMLAAAGLIVVAVWCLIRRKRDMVDVARAATALIGCYLLLTTPRYAWYYAWLVPFLALVPRAGWLYLTCASALLYLVWYTPLVYPEIPLWLGWCIFSPVIGWVAWDRLSGRSEYRL
ncbi:MAG TPA: glycosyltransferase 87 family protein [Blastocatellia bacterium]|nr:glycosyltransferase 87 family protein [Blastocatellia bacterium]